MSTFKSLPEFLTYALLVIIILFNITGIILIIRVEQAIENNQRVNALAVKTYIACLLVISPTLPRSQALTAAQICFDNSPKVN